MQVIRIERKLVLVASYETCTHVSVCMRSGAQNLQWEISTQNANSSEVRVGKMSVVK